MLNANGNLIIVKRESVSDFSTAFLCDVDGVGQLCIAILEYLVR